MNKKKMVRNKKLAVAAKMPPLYHRLPGQDYDPRKSEVLAWMITQPELLNYIYGKASARKEIVYDSETGVWTGVEYDGS